VNRLLHTIDKTTGEIIKERPRALPRQTTAVVEIRLEDARGRCLEMFKESKDYGRFTLRRQGVTIAAGIITKLLQ
jgi:elongation factor 1 alpha-like protein